MTHCEPVPMARPVFEVDQEVLRELGAVLESGMVTNGRLVRAFEQEVAEHLGVACVVAVSSCTTGLMLVLRCLGLRGDVVIPSFTFMATGHAVIWNGLTPRFADVDPATCTLDPASVDAVVDGASAVLAVHTFGAPCDTVALQEVADRRGVPLVVDAAHGFGSRYPDGTAVGTKGVAEVFSLSPTKPLSTGEGGLIATTDEDFASELRVAREYGNPGDYDSRMPGLSGRMTELAAVLGRANLRTFPRWAQRRRALVDRYRRGLAEVVGVEPQRVPAGALSSYKDFVVRVDAEAFGGDRDDLADRLRRQGISTRSYFDPPLHRQSAYRHLTPGTPLPHTEALCAEMLTLPLYPKMEDPVVDRICRAIGEGGASA
ncbi:DegT/DnrJ/EryC1/StrS family aminotransferase [Saccharothrix coeruleofusca]|nr:DegT/DnrJ/EryC1/StrS family aminotransferase [Saccharothrix coeruleofusca]MBP2336681.1 dTDP-4-amino-4,6-dideoxygalactose transaminase [Saccharothrix coeruleofusca]